jgi:hypothetical protein
MHNADEPSFFILLGSTEQQYMVLWQLTYILTYLLTYLLTHSLTHSMVQDIIWKAESHSACQKKSCFLYGIWRFTTVFKKPHHWTLSWASWIQFGPSIPIYLTFISMLYSHLHLGLPSGLLPSASQPIPCKHLSPPPCMPHIKPTSSSLL